MYKSGFGGSTGFFFARYDARGSLRFAKILGTFAEYEYANGVASYSDGSFVIGGQAYETIFGLGEPRESCLCQGFPETPGGAFVARFNADGGF